MISQVDYNRMWSDTWGDVQVYGPSHRIHRQILLRMTAGLSFDSVLEVGCGNGLNLAALKCQHPHLQLAGADISDKALSMLKAAMPEVSVHKLDAASEALPRTFDLVICFDVLEHIEDDKQAIKHLAAMTGKYLLVATLQGRMQAFEAAIGHVRNYAPGELTRNISAAGMRILNVVEWGWPLYSPLYRSWLDRGGQQMTTGTFGILEKVACHVLFGLFQLNSSNKGDMIFVLAAPER